MSPAQPRTDPRFPLGVDHRVIDELVADYYAARHAAARWRIRAGERDACWRALSARLRAHARREALLLDAYEAAIPAPDARLDELRMARAGLLEELDALDGWRGGESSRAAAEQALLNRLWAHEDAVEALLLPWLRDRLDERARQSLSARLNAAA